MAMLSPFEFMKQLRERGIYFTLASHREDYLMFQISVPGERWEVEFSSTGEVEIEIFRSDGSIQGPEAMDDLLKRFSD